MNNSGELLPSPSEPGQLFVRTTLFEGDYVTALAISVSYSYGQMHCEKESRIVRHLINSFCLLVLFLTFFAADRAYGQSQTVSSSRAALIESTQKYKLSSAELLRLQEEELRKASQKLEQTRQLVSEGLVARRELADGEQELANLNARVAATRQAMADADRTIAEVMAEDSQRTLPLNSKSLTKQTVLRYNTAGPWSLADVISVQAFFLKTFGRTLPISAFAQTAAHNQLGWDHRNAVDVGLHPDSIQGKALVDYLRNHNIPFLAFRGAIPGVATGPHIHIGNPSSRL